MSGLPENLILRGLEASARDRLLAAGRRDHLPFGHEIGQPGDVVERVIFPEDGLISIIVQSSEGQETEGGMIGREGVLGLFEACGSGVITTHCAIQAAGASWSIPASVCRGVMAESETFRALAMRSAEFQLVETRQAALCRSYHPVEARLARWLLEMADRSAQTGRFLALTQEYLAAMLAVQRTTISAAAAALKRRGLIRYLRGEIELTDRPGLEATACHCWRLLKTERERIFGEA